MKNRRDGGGRRIWWALGAAVLGLLLWAGLGNGDHHPAPRADVGAASVVPAARYATYPDIARTYATASEIPHVLDGLYCYCDCVRHSGHYSLLDCFRNDHAAGCNICLSEAVLAHDMTRDGASLDAVRDAIDGTFGP